MPPNTMKVFGGSSNPCLTKEICKVLSIPEGKIKLNKFADGEIGVKIQETTRGCDVYLVQSTSTPVNDNLMELLIMVDAFKRASSKKITAVIPYYGYARQDRKTQPRVPISAALVASLLTASGIDRVLSVDLHCGQIQGFFKNSVPVDNLNAQCLLCAGTKEFFLDLDISNVCIVSPDAGGAERADMFRDAIKSFYKQKLGKLNGKAKVTMAVMNKKRVEANKVQTMELVGDVKGAECIIVDDMIDTAGTLCKAAEKLKEKGAKRVFAVATHALLNGPGVERIEKSCLEKVLVTNTVPLKKEKLIKSTKIIPVSVGNLLGEAIRRIHNDEPLSKIFQSFEVF